MHPKTQATMFSSASGEYETPHDLFDKLWNEFGGFDLDPCCWETHHTARRIIDGGGGIFVPISERPTYQAIDGLAQPWHGKVYLNPPYGRQIGRWVEKAWREVFEKRAELVVSLLPARTDTRWWQAYVLQDIRSPDYCDYNDALAEVHGEAHEVRFLPGRLRFVGATNAAPFPSAVVVWRA